MSGGMGLHSCIAQVDFESGHEEYVTNEKIRYGYILLTQVGIEIPEFYGSKIEEHPLEFIDEVSRVLNLVGVTLVEKAEWAVYQLKDVSLMWFSQWKRARPVEAGPMEWERFKNGFIDRFCPLEMRKAKILEFINLHQGRMSVKEYARVFTNLSRYCNISQFEITRKKLIIGKSHF
ncbi:hypothetical protein MTR67_033972 [Solanum verrucosum]|uniref:Retrotransposon gag domain-containing protein n=1 Tax=Solanum verrucosum TaxID=315347 RepID=A0AAF0U7C5_SOLVR|nr:hypothetical protein MTR67_033972 [Solanum verrucosum]